MGQEAEGETGAAVVVTACLAAAAESEVSVSSWVCSGAVFGGLSSCRDRMRVAESRNSVDATGIGETVGVWYTDRVSGVVAFR